MRKIRPPISYSRTVTDEIPQDMTIEDLARRADVATTTVRLYQTRGLLPAPRRDGRIGRYGPGHLARLHLIARLQERGFSLASIKQLVDAWEAGRGLDDLLGLEGRLPGLDASTDLRLLPPDELAARFPAGTLTAEVLERARQLGLVRTAEDGRLAVQPGFLDVGAALVSMGIPIEELLDEQEALDDAMHRVALRFAGLFERHLWHDFVADGMPAERLTELTELLRRLDELATTVVVAALRNALRQVSEELAADEAKNLAGSPGAPASAESGNWGGRRQRRHPQ
jgi:DNA-binding transcriptional MerR regulator